MTTTEAPAVVHYQDCDDLALGRYVRTRAPIVDIDRLFASGVPAFTDLSSYRDGCDCARLRVAAIDTQIDRTTKARRVARNTGDEVTFARLTQVIAGLREEKAAIAELARVAGATS